VRGLGSEENFRQQPWMVQQRQEQEAAAAAATGSSA